MFFFERRWLALHNTPTGGCRELSSEGRCQIYSDRPVICHVYPVGGADCLKIVQERRTSEQYAAIREECDPPIRRRPDGVIFAIGDRMLTNLPPLLRKRANGSNATA